MSRGLKPRLFADHRRYDFHRTFKSLVKAKLGAVGGTIPDFILPIYSNPNQNIKDDYWPRPPLPEGCTGFAQAHIAESDVKQPVDPQQLYRDTLAISGGNDGDPCTLEDSFRAATINGVRLKGEPNDQAHRMAPRWEIRPTLTMDWYDAILAAMYANQRPASAGTSWPPQFEMVGIDGLQWFMPVQWVGGHDHCFIGKKTIGGVERLVDISWNGSGWADQGLSYFTREQVNALMRIKGTDCLTSRILSGEEVKTVWVNMLLQLQILTLILSLYQRLKRQKQPATPLIPIDPTTMTPVPTPTIPESETKPDMLTRFCTAIMNFEGGQGDPNHINNNPCDFRCSPVGYLPKYGKVGCRNNFAVFPTFDLGWEYLLNSVHFRANAHPAWTIHDFFMNYAPPSDNNPTDVYAATVAKACGVPVSTTLHELFA